MKTALSIVQSVCKRINHPVPSTLIPVTDPDEIQMIELLVAVCEELRQARCWTQQKRKFTWATTAARATYPLPADFFSPLLATHYNTDEDLMLVGPQSDSDFAVNLYGASTSTTNFSYRIFGSDEDPSTVGGQIELSPTPSSAIDLAFEYVTRSFFIPKFWVAGTAYALNSYCSANGNIYKCNDAITAADTQPTGKSSTPVADDDGFWTYYPSAYEAIVADTDLVIFDDDLVKLGLRAKLLEDRGGEFEGPAAEFQSKIDRAVSRYKGSFVGAFGGGKAGPRYKVPSGNWSI